jgi:hypothetical protein
LQVGHDFGQWRVYGYGILAVYRSDYQHVGGFNLDIDGWGLEDNDLLVRFLKAAQPRYEIHRAYEHSLIHHWHPKVTCVSPDAFC